MRLLGLDPGPAAHRLGRDRGQGNALRFLAAGVVVTEAGDDLALRLDALYRGLKEVVARHGPTVAAVEETVSTATPAPRSSSARRAAWCCWPRPTPA